MSAAVPIKVICRKDGQVVHIAELGYGETLAGTGRPSDEELIGAAKEDLSILGVAKPPYEGITFEVKE